VASSLDSDSIPRFSWLPEIDTVILDAADDPPQGGGEPATAVVERLGATYRNNEFDRRQRSDNSASDTHHASTFQSQRSRHQPIVP